MEKLCSWYFMICKKVNIETGFKIFYCQVLVDMEEQEAKEAAIQKDDRKRSYNSMAEVAEPTEEQMEAYKLKKHMAQDPMSKFKDTT